MTWSERKANVIFNKIVVNSIEDASGIFIGTNEAIGWASYSKGNSGFGSISDSSVSRIVSVLRDPDIVDTAIRDAKIISMSETGGSARQSAVDFQSVNVNHLSNSSAVDLGDIRQPGWRTARKSNYGEGKIIGNNQISRTINILFDDDAVDSSFSVRQNVLERSDGTARNVAITHKGASAAGNPEA